MKEILQLALSRMIQISNKIEYFLLVKHHTPQKYRKNLSIHKNLKFSTINTVAVFNELLYFTTGALRNVTNNPAKKLTLVKTLYGIKNSLELARLVPRSTFRRPCRYALFEELLSGINVCERWTSYKMV